MVKRGPLSALRQSKNRRGQRPAPVPGSEGLGKVLGFSPRSYSWVGMEEERSPGARTHVTSLGTHAPLNPGWGEREAEAGGHLASPSPEATPEAWALSRG